MTAARFGCLALAHVVCVPLWAAEVTSGDGLRLRFSDDGSVAAVLSGGSRFSPATAPRPMFALRELGADAWQPAEWILQGTNARGTVPQLGLAVTATFVPFSDRIEVRGAVLGLRGEERSVELMCALPGHADRVLWGVDTEEKVDPCAKPPSLSVRDEAQGPYRLWIDAFDLDPQMATVSVVGPGGTERTLAVLAAPDTAELVNQKWHTFVLSGLRDSDFDDGALSVRIANLPGGPTLMDLGGLYLMDARQSPADDAAAEAMVAQDEARVVKDSLGSWIVCPGYRPKDDKRQWFFQRKTLSVEDGSWIELGIRKGQHIEGSLAGLDAGQAPPRPGADGLLRGAGYPWATLTEPGAAGYTCALSPELPCRYRFQYDVERGQVQCVVAYGLSAHPLRRQVKSRAPFRFILYRTDDAWGFREAAERYYRLAPGLFKRPTDRFGFWYGAGPYKDYRGLDGLYAYLEVHEARLYPRRFIKDRATWEEWKASLAEYIPQVSDLGVLVLPYRHFYHCSLHVKGDMDGTLPHMPKTYDEGIHMLRTLPLPFANGYAHHIREVIDSSAMQRKNGRLDMKLSADDACAPTGRLIFRTSISPYLYEDRPEVMTNARAEMEFARELLAACPQVGGIYYDAGAGGGGVDHDPAHLRYAQSPLAPGPGISRMAGKYHFGRWMGEYLHGQGKIHFVNGGAGMGPGQVWHMLPFDAIGVEWPPVIGGMNKLRFLRTLARHKPVNFLKIQVVGDPDAAVADYVSKLGLYGVFPPPGVMVTGTRKRGGSIAESIAPYAKVLQAIYLAGWEPVTHARCRGRDVLVERYGPRDGKVHFAVYNPSRPQVSAQLTIDAEALGLPRLSKAVAIFAPEPALELRRAKPGTYRVDVTVPGRRLVVVQAGVDAVDDPQQLMDAYPARHRAWREEAGRPRLVGHWRFDEGSGQVVHDATDSKAHGALGRQKGGDASDPAWTPDGRAGAALRFDGKDDMVRIGHVGKLRIDRAFTVEAWIKRGERTTHARVVDFGGTCIYFEASGDKAGLRIGGYSVNTAWSSPIPLGQWTRLTASYDGKTIRMCVDGKLCNAKDYACNTPLSGQGFTIGNTGNIPRPFAGLIDEVRIWNYAR